MPHQVLKPCQVHICGEKNEKKHCSTSTIQYSRRTVPGNKLIKFSLKQKTIQYNNTQCGWGGVHEKKQQKRNLQELQTFVQILWLRYSDLFFRHGSIITY